MILSTIITKIIDIIIGGFIGSGVTYKIMHKKYVKVTKIKQKQKSNNESQQVQIRAINEQK